MFSTQADCVSQRKLYFDSQITILEDTLKTLAKIKPHNHLQTLEQIEIQLGKQKEIEQFISNLKTIDEDGLNLICLNTLKNNFEYMQGLMKNKSKLNISKQSLEESTQLDLKRGHKFSKSTNLILKQWLYQNYAYPYPSLEDSTKLAMKCRLTQKQIQIWFINARGRISNKLYEEKKFKNIVKQTYLSLKPESIKKKSIHHLVK